MSKPTFSYGLSLSKKPTSSKPAPPKRKPVFGGDDDSDDDSAAAATSHGAQANAPGGFEEVHEVGGLDASLAIRAPTPEKPRKSKSKTAPLPTKPPTLKSKAGPTTMFGDLSGSLASRRNAEEGEKVDASIYEYDAVYDSIKPQRNKKDDEAVGEDGAKKARYMTGLLAASNVRKRDQQIAEERRIAREREAEGEEFQDKEKFVTAAYRRQQEENRKAREEEERREREEAEKGKGGSGGMTDFYKNLLDRENKERAEVVKAAEEKAREGPSEGGQDEGPDKEKTDAELAKELEAKGISVAVNEDGQIVDKRQLLKGGLNVVAKKPEPKRDVGRSSQQRDQAGWSRGQGRGFVGAGGGKRAMVERQSRMMEEQLNETLKRSRQAEEEERQKTIEKLSKSTKSDKDISSARERYLARKREAEEAKKKGAAP